MTYAASGSRPSQANLCNHRSSRRAGQPSFFQEAATMAVRIFRDPIRPEKAFIADVLRRLREHFHEWNKGDEAKGHEHSLIGFAFYEGCGDSRHCGEILAEAAPFALGQEL